MIRDIVQKAILMRWIAEHIVNLGQDPDWVFSSTAIIKASLIFIDKFWWIIVSSRIRVTQEDNILMQDHTVWVPSLLLAMT